MEIVFDKEIIRHYYYTYFDDYRECRKEEVNECMEEGIEYDSIEEDKYLIEHDGICYCEKYRNSDGIIDFDGNNINICGGYVATKPMIEKYDLTFWCDCPSVPARIIIDKHGTDTIDIIKYMKKIENIYGG